MIPKGNQRGGGQQLATHLLNSYDNDRVEVIDMRGAIAQDLHGAFAEWYADSKATKCVKYLYSLSINPDHTQGPYNREHYDDFVRRVEDRLGLDGQPRAIVVHVKHGREHWHVVWSRINTDKMKAVQLSYDHEDLRTVAQEYARDHEIILPEGMRQNRGKDRYADRDKQENLGDKQREERTGIGKPQRQREISEAWHASDSGPSFIKALEERCYYVACGDRCAYAVVDLYGEVVNLAKQVEGVKTKQLKARLGEPEKLMDIAAAQERALRERQARLKNPQRQAETHGTPEERRAALQRVQAERREKLEDKRRDLAAVHNGERKALAELQDARSAAVAEERAAKQPKGVMAFLARITGYNALAAFRHAREDRQRIAEQRQQTSALIRRHRREMQNFRHEESALDSVDKREKRSLETALRREALQRLRAGRTIQPEFTAAAAGKPDIKKGDDGRKEKLKRDFAAAAKGKEETGKSGGAGKGSEAAAAFNRAAEPRLKSKAELRQAFEDAKKADKPQPASAGGGAEQEPAVDEAKREEARKAKEEYDRRTPRPGPEKDRER